MDERNSRALRWLAVAVVFAAAFAGLVVLGIAHEMNQDHAPTTTTPRVAKCKFGDNRCNGTMVQVCGWDGWQDFKDCGSIGERCETKPEYCGGYVDTACCR